MLVDELGGTISAKCKQFNESFVKGDWDNNMLTLYPIFHKQKIELIILRHGEKTVLF